MTRRAVLKACALAGAAAVGGPGLYGFLHERHALALTEAVVPVSELPAALAGLRLGLLTDVHRSRWVSADEVTHAVGRLMAARPDLVILGGDYVTWGDRHYVGSSAEALSGLMLRTASLPFSAITMTITTCLLRWQHAVCRFSGMPEPT